MSPVIHYWIGDVQDSQCVSASEMTYIVSDEALNSTHSLTLPSYVSNNCREQHCVVWRKYFVVTCCVSAKRFGLRTARRAANSRQTTARVILRRVALVSHVTSVFVTWPQWRLVIAADVSLFAAHLLRLVLPWWSDGIEFSLFPSVETHLDFAHLSCSLSSLSSWRHVTRRCGALRTNNMHGGS